MKPWAGLAAALLVVGCDPAPEAPAVGGYTLYRSGAVIPGMEAEDRRALDAMRIHVATFDAGHGEAYNRENCERAVELFGSQPMVTSKYWCEKGSYRP